ncbi:MAG: hypothetical protein AMJ65_08180 [Phycisphaerae bacterium SG8_4]|nr:MAG: hypothetical protein AMJ65_08180 [Phycisphaerae bacterium SG8_4]
MRTVIVLMAMLLLVGCGQSMSIEAGRAQRTDLKTRLLVEVVDGVEVGPVATWTDAEELDNSPPEPSQDPAAPWPLPGLENVRLVPYATIEWLDYVDNDNWSNWQPQYGLGTEMELAENLYLYSEYSTGDTLPDDVYLGLGYGFEF